jgi:hypothetical protein
MFTVTIHFHMQDTQRWSTSDPLALLMSLNMGTVRDLQIERNS